MKRYMIFFLLIVASSAAFAGHRGIPLTECTVCHTPNLVNEHGGFSSTACWKCHASMEQNVMDTIDRGTSGQPVYCADCHGTETHTAKHVSYISEWMIYSGVEPAGAPLWTQITSFSAADPAQKQYQVCLACHSYYAFGAVPHGVTGMVGPSGYNLTDQAMEFNPANKSAHPVWATLNSMTGSYAPRALAAAQMSSLWKNVGNQLINCSDCHEVSSTTGPHGSAYQFALKGTRKYWPRNKTNGLLWTLYDLKNNRNNWNSDLFCANCHTLFSGGKFMNKVHDDGNHTGNDKWPKISKYPNGASIPESEKYIGVPCVMCHVTIPHGAKRSRFIVYKDEPFPYNYRNVKTTGPDKSFSSFHGGLMGVMTGYKKSSNPSNYDEIYCYIPKNETYPGQSGQPRWGCDDHEDNRMAYDQ